MYVSEPEPEEIVLNLIPHRLTATLGAYRPFLPDDSIFLFQDFQLPPYALHAQRGFDLTLCDIAVCYLVQDTEVRKAPATCPQA